MPSAPMPYSSGRILAATADGVATLTFNQPEKRNAMLVEMWDGLAEVLRGWAEDDDVRVVVLTGAGDKAFVSGADISQFAQSRSDAAAQIEYGRLTEAGRAALATFPKPVIARIHGFCLGGGLGIAISADLRIASQSSSFGIPAAKLGIAYGWDMVQALVALVGPAHARMLLFTGERIAAEEAVRIGLVNQCVADAALDATVHQLAQTIAANAPLSVRGMKHILAQAGTDPAERDMAGVAHAISACFDSADYLEGRTAFMQKRRPRFEGR